MMNATNALDPRPLPPRFDSPLHFGSVRLASRFNLAPLAGFTNVALRRTIRELGGLGLATTDLVNARAILEGKSKTMELLATRPDDQPLAVQIFGSNADEMVSAAQWLQDRGVPIVDINMGCPVRKVVRTGGGSALMCDPAGTVKLLERVVRAVVIPITVKMRLGWDDENVTAPFFARLFEEVGVAAITIHGRTREQGFSGKVNLEGIRRVVEAVRSIPVVGNGDVKSVADAAAMFQKTGCHAIAVGRGALANPWIFRQLDSWLNTGDPGVRASWNERLDFMERHFRRLVEWRGEHFGCLQFRRVATWYARSLRTGKAIQQRLVLVSSPAMFDEIVEEIRQRGEPADWSERDLSEYHVAVPSGPMSHW